MAFRNGPNKTVAAARKKIGGYPTRDRNRPFDEFHLWLFSQAKAGAKFKTLEEAMQAFKKQAKE